MDCSDVVNIIKAVSFYGWIPIIAFGICVSMIISSVKDDKKSVKDNKKDGDDNKWWKKYWIIFFEIFIMFSFLWMGALSISLTFIMPKYGIIFILYYAVVVSIQKIHDKHNKQAFL